LRTALLAEPHHLEAGTADDVTMALQLARERVAGTVRALSKAAHDWLSALRNLPDTVVVCQVVAELERQRLAQPPATAQAIEHIVQQLQAWIETADPETTAEPA
jgi:hypothetical protein